MQEWLTVNEVAELRQIAARTVIDLIHKGELEAKKDGRRWLILMDVPPDTAAKPPDNAAVIGILKAQLEEKDKQIAALQNEMSQSRDQANQLLAALTQQNQQLLEDKRPWYGKLFRKRKT
jgi:excisionase family DNA binding protein